MLCCVPVCMLNKMFNIFQIGVNSHTSLLGIHLLFLASSLEFSDCEDGQLRLTNYSDTSNTSRNGTLQLCLNHAWGTICADQFYGGADALVACNHLEGFQSEGAMAYSVQQRGDPVFLGQLDCEGNEESLLSCVMYSSIGLVSCESNLDAAVSCRGTCVSENKSNICPLYTTV